MASRSVLLMLVLCLTTVFSTAFTEHCFADPSQPNCEDAAAYYRPSAMQADMEMLCSSNSWTTGCSLWRKCSSGLASGTYCEPWNLISDVCGDEATRSSESCRRYTLLCRPASTQTVVKQCTESEGMPNFLQTADAIASMQRLCVVMPTMQWCSECTTSDDPATNCKDPLSSISAICLDHYMDDCTSWYEMCKAQPAGIEVFCGASGERPVTADDEVCIGQMKMYFHGGMTDIVLFDSWVPCTPGRYAGTLIAIIVVGIFTGLLKGVRARLEQRWIAELAAEPVEPRVSWGMLPKGKQRWMNFVRMVFVFVVVTFDYALMLAAMTFNTGIFFAVIFGMALGSLLFGHTVVPLRTHTTSSPLNGSRTEDGGDFANVSRDQLKNSTSSCCVDMPL